MAHDGTSGGIRTHTAMVLSHLPPAIGLPKHIQELCIEQAQLYLQESEE